jgi:hypothetical protein
MLIAASIECPLDDSMPPRPTSLPKETVYKTFQLTFQLRFCAYFAYVFGGVVIIASLREAFKAMEIAWVFAKRGSHCPQHRSHQSNLTPLRMRTRMRKKKL